MLKVDLFVFYDLQSTEIIYGICKLLITHMSNMHTHRHIFGEMDGNDSCSDSGQTCTICNDFTAETFIVE